MKKKIMTGVIVIIVLFGIWGILVKRANKEFPQTKEIVYNNNEWVTAEVLGKNIEVKVQDGYFMEEQEIRDSGKVPEEAFFTTDIRLLWIRFSVRNSGTEAIEVSPLQLSAESRGWSNVADREFLSYLSEDDEGWSIQLSAGEEKEFCYPYLMVQQNFRKSEWEKVYEKEYWMTLSLYPEKKMIPIEII